MPCLPASLHRRLHRLQAERWGARLETEDVVSVDLSTRPFTVRGTENTVKAHSVIVATVRLGGMEQVQDGRQKEARARCCRRWLDAAVAASYAAPRLTS